MSWHSDFKFFTDKLNWSWLRLKKHKKSDPEIKLNRINTSFLVPVYNKIFREHGRVVAFLKIFLFIYLVSLSVHINPSQNVSPILLLNYLAIGTNKGSIACKYFRWENYRIFVLNLHILFVFEIFHISLYR